ncbi:CTP synthase [Candidatus Daviesbacteria bacterium RIFCSPHIGHO2_12_FULL_37_11]|uniref:CTP synthase n=1 Tax=Candidatus Daviesbacteria bacterium RIFCSPHIGHO2_12_FULL_37_11 TaxID=1797777 RepID=A0A1F5KA14_9BACT|nr:MAG: CTP synthase [Candidatus Daviesbacteria bacterium RIFCSPHIGHO2_01_FULL_37_27]OGE37654.1 MAG: CTP synthase [Candidatus Daviesbacteria bacterium RIFCSPHIGHO2_12_FULL_37_11]
MKYIFVSGGVISGIGKGIATSSIALLLKSAGYKVSPLKIDPYLNIDAGTMNPIHHGEVFVLDDGSETDQDLGNYERFLNEDLNKANYTTSGQVYLSVIQRERALEYDGECVEAVPHIPEEINKRIENAGKSMNADIVVIEIGGTVGELQNVFIFEANRLLKQKKSDDVLHVHVSYLPVPASIGEMKSKPVQMSVRELNSMGIQPDILLARSEVKIDDTRRKKLGLFCNISAEDIIAAPDVKSIYEVPVNFEEENLTERILGKLKLKRKNKDLREWRKFTNKIKSAEKQIKIGIVGKYFSTGDFTLSDSYVSVIEAIKHASWTQGFNPEITWVDSGKILSDLSLLSNLDGVIVPGGFGSRDIDGKIEAIKYCRENKISYLGLCYGMQMAVIEYARNVLRLQNANTTEIDPGTKFPVIHIMPDQEKKMLERDYGASMRLGAWDCKLKPGTMAKKLYGKSEISERHRHRYEFNNQYLKELVKNGMVISGTSPDGKLVEIIELKGHPFFVGTQFHPELKSRPLNPHPLFMGFIKAASLH